MSVPGNEEILARLEAIEEKLDRLLRQSKKPENVLNKTMFMDANAERSEFQIPDGSLIETDEHGVLRIAGEEGKA